MNIKILVLLFFVAIAGLASCKSDGDIAPVVNTTELKVVNADINTLNIFQNGTRINNLSSIGPGGASGYLAVASGQQQYELKQDGAATPNYLFGNYTLNLDSTKSYSLFIAGETPDKLFIVNDIDNLADSATVSMIRFVDASPGANLDVSLRDSLKFTNRAFTKATSFNYISSGVSTIKIYQAGSSTPIVNTTITLQPGIFYTLFAKGIIGGSGQNILTAQLTTN